MSGLSFLDKFNKSTAKMDEVSQETTEPELFFDTGSAIINKIISGSYRGGYPEGAMTMIAGPANSGKSFLVGNAIKQAQDAGYGVLAIDSEHALTARYLRNLGIDTKNPLFDYKGVGKIGDAKKILSEFLKLYKSAPESEQIPFLITIDSLDELRTTSQAEKDEKGEIHKDMGLKVKELAEMQSMLTHSIANYPIAVIATKQPYVNQDTYTNKREPYVVTQKLRFAYTQILFVTNKLIKNKTTNKFEGIDLEVYGFKTRLTQPFQKCVIEVPYETGMDWYSGVLEAAESLDIVKRSGSWYKFDGNNFQRGNFEEYKEQIFEALLEREGEVIEYEEDEEEV